MNAISKITPARGSEERSVPREAVLTSATDPRGVITFAGTDFCNIAEYSADQLLNAPHKIVRHGDMPKGVFYLMWETLKAGKPICAYVKNRTANDNYYWVLAVVSLTENGYMSARIHPETEYFDLAKGLYEEMLVMEADRKSPEDSANWLLEQLQENGFSNIEAFSEVVLNAEFKNRNIVSPKNEAFFALMDEILGLATDMRQLAKNIETGFKRVRGEPVNLRILAGRLEGAGAALGTISQNYDAMAQEMYELLGRLYGDETGALADMDKAVSHGRTAQQFSQLLSEAFERENETQTGGGQLDLLVDHHARLESICQQRIREIALAGKSIPDICRSLRRRINGLDVVKLLCKVESGRMREVDSGLDGIIERLQAFHDDTDTSLAELSAKASQIQQKMSAF
ncbi:Aerotaxis receptor [Shimia sp. SK013]|uniref:PAS domain-containing protein n=1 Tax=Shimia sp. SK013 TaxID=1389006 RepID=UPI0006B4A8E7|nr:PAS domain-containing protein [Shimia sp. SK013]KPA20856.1 Aerotaxis receptor [Shimia sp. SK013]